MQVTMGSASARQTQKIASVLAGWCVAGDCLMLEGDLGAGKTTFARGFVGALCDVEDEVVSPTFTLAQTYPARSGGTVWHFDLYRLKSPVELDEIGLEDALASGISLIEWPDLARGRLPAGALTVQIIHGATADTRRLTLPGEVVRWRPCFDALAKERA